MSAARYGRGVAAELHQRAQRLLRDLPDVVLVHGGAPRVGQRGLLADPQVVGDLRAGVRHEGDVGDLDGGVPGPAGSRRTRGARGAAAPRSPAPPPCRPRWSPARRTSASSSRSLAGGLGVGGRSARRGAVGTRRGGGDLRGVMPGASSPSSPHAAVSGARRRIAAAASAAVRGCLPGLLWTIWLTTGVEGRGQSAFPGIVQGIWTCRQRSAVKGFGCRDGCGGPGSPLWREARCCASSAGTGCRASGSRSASCRTSRPARCRGRPWWWRARCGSRPCGRPRRARRGAAAGGGPAGARGALPPVVAGAAGAGAGRHAGPPPGLPAGGRQTGRGARPRGADLDPCPVCEPDGGGGPAGGRTGDTRGGERAGGHQGGRPAQDRRGTADGAGPGHRDDGGEHGNGDGHGNQDDSEKRGNGDGHGNQDDGERRGNGDGP